ncbi:MAG: hypothetical protein ACT4OI_11570 [Methanobacteriota archaeon]
MALRALTPGRATYCSACGAEAPGDAETCPKCGAFFEGYMDAVLCPICNVVNPADTAECVKCEAKFPEPRRVEGPQPAGEEAHLRRVLQLSKEKARGRPGPAPPAADAVPYGPAEPRSMTEDARADDLETALWKLAEPFDRMLRRRRKRLEQAEGLIERARQRIQELAKATDPAAVNEREQLKLQVEDLLLEKEDVLRLEEGLAEMENTYRNILRMQQEELKARESSLRSRLEAFRNELESREQTFGRMREREADMIRREDEFRQLVNRIHEREQEINKREDLLREKTRLTDERHHSLSEAEVELERRRWDLEQKASRMPPGARDAEKTITVGPPERELNDLRGRLSELEEQVERLAEEKNRLTEERQDLASLRDDVGSVLKVLDDLLAELPEARIRAFAKSPTFTEYEKLFARLKL